MIEKSITEPIFSKQPLENFNLMSVNYIFRKPKASKYLEFIMFFTDGSKQTSGSVGASAYIKKLQ